MLRFIASGFYSGYLPKAPGTWGTLVSLPLILIGNYYSIDLLSASILIFVLGWYVSQQLTQDPMSDPDPSYIVIDEIAGMFFAVGLSLTFNLMTMISPLNLAVLFVLFRIFDIWKPWPICWVDDICTRRVSTRGLGVMIDDMIAGLFAAISFAVLSQIMYGQS